MHIKNNHNYIAIIHFFGKRFKLMQGVEALRSKTRLLLENKKQNTFTFENNFKSMRVP